jgi:SdpC family antimicrobial peptide
MAVSLLVASCTQNAGITSEAAINAKSLNLKYSGQEIFEGLFFFQNDLALQVSQLKEVATKMEETRIQNPETATYISGLAASTSEYINSNYPTFFEDFKAAMYSGDYYRIDQAIKQAGRLIEQAILTSEEYSSLYALGKEIGKDPELIAEIQSLDMTDKEDAEKLEALLANVKGFDEVDSKAVGVAAVVAAVYLVAGAVNTVVAAYYLIAAAAVVTKLALWDVFKLGSPEDSELADEMLVAEIGSLFTGEN